MTLVLDATDGSAGVLSDLAEVLRSALGPVDRLVVVDPAAGLPPATATAPRLGRLKTGARVQRRIVEPGLLATLTEERPADVLVVVDHTGRIPNAAAVAELVAVLLATGANAAVPASNAGPFPQCPPDPLDPGATRAEVRAEARRCLERSRGRHHEVLDFSGAMVAMAPGTLTGPMIPGSGLVAAVRHSLLREGPEVVVVVATGSYVHSVVPAPQISVCLIVKDEAADLAACLASVSCLADEVIIYDTGSVDDTVAVARGLGATVIEGEWRNDFGWARNQAMAAARGTWILSIDADERLEIDHRAIAELRGLLSDGPPVDRFIVDLFDLQGSVHAPVRSANAVPMARLFRRRHCHWVGALHEQPDSRAGREVLRSVHLPGVTLLHRGYLDEIVAAKGKWQRNLSVAAAGVANVPDNDKDCFDLARSLRSVGEHARALALFERAADLAQNPVITRGALEFVILTLTESTPPGTDPAEPADPANPAEFTGLAGLTEPYLVRLEALAGGTEPARYLRGWVAVRQRRWSLARRCFEDIGDYHDHFTGFRAESVPLGLALAYRGLDRPADAAAAAITALQRNPLALEAWAVLFDTTPAGGPEEADLVASINAEHLVALVATLSRFDAAHRDRVCEARWATHPGESVVLAAAAQVAPDLPAASALRWSARLRASGLAELCPFRGVAEDGSRTVPERADRLAGAIEGLTEVELEAPDLLDDLAGLVARLHDEELATLLDTCLAHSPAAAAPVILAGANTVNRGVVIMETLVRAGFGEQALAVLSHTADADPDATRRALQGRPDLIEQLRQIAGSDGRHDLDVVLQNAA